MKPVSKKAGVVKGPDKVIDKPKLFLQNFLSGGPICRTNVYREAENMGLSWEDVKRAFGELNGYEWVQRGEHFWKIVPD